MRMLPEILSWPYPLGYDTVAYYLPKMVIRFGLRVSDIPELLRFDRGLLYLLASLMATFFGDCFMALKFLGPLLYGLLSLILYVYVEHGLRMGWKKAFTASMLFSLSLLSLRVSWDLYRNMLGLIFALTTLTLVERRSWLATPTALVTVLSHELSSAMLMAMLIVRLVAGRRFGWRDVGRGPLVASATSSVALFVCQRLITPAVSPPQIVLSRPLEGATWLASDLYFFTLASAPLLILAAPSIGRLRGDVDAWSALTAAAFTLSVVGVGAPWYYRYRVLLMMCIPLPIYASETLSSKTGIVKAVALATLLAVAVPYLMTSPSKPWNYYALAASPVPRVYTRMPSGFLQNVVPLDEFPYLDGLMKEAVAKVPNGCVLVMPRQFYGLALYYLGPRDGLIDVGEVSLTRGGLELVVEAARGLNTTGKIYTVWWGKANMWYGVSKIPESFKPVVASGPFTLYEVEVDWE